MEMISAWDNLESYKCLLTFDNGLTYEAFSDSKEEDEVEGADGEPSILLDRRLLTLSTNEDNAITSGNPVGIVSPNSCNVVLWDEENTLIPTNKQSPYYGYMRNGVKVELFISDDDGKTWSDYGVYYTEGWNVTKDNGSFQSANLICTDKLSYIGNMDIPKLSAYAGVSVVDLLKNIFKAVGLSTGDYHIDSSLSLDLVYAITKGDKLRDVLNTIAQSLIARVTVNRSGVIQVMPAFPAVVMAGQLDSDDMETIQVAHNSLSMYNKVKLNYNKVDKSPSEVLVSLSNIRIKEGLNTFYNIAVSQNILSIDGVYLEYAGDSASDTSIIKYIDYRASQGGIDVDIYSNSAKAFYADLSVEGRPTGITEAYVESSITSADPKVANTLALESYVIQDEAVAQTYVNNVANYLYKMEQEITISGTLNPYLEPSMYVEIATGDGSVDGTYLITKFSVNVSESYNTSMTLIKIRW